MAIQDALNQLAKKPLKYKLGVMAGVLVGIGVIYYQLMWSSLSETKGQEERRKSSLIEKQRKLNKDLEEQKRLAQQNEELQRSIRDNQKALPTEAELPAFFDHLQRKAGDSGVNIRRWERREEKDVDIYIRVPVYMEISGTYYNIMRYFALLGPQTKDALQLEGEGEGAAERVDERIVSIENLSLGDIKLKDGEVELTAKLTASTFRQQGSSPDATAATSKGTAKKGK
jgi:Tfp pilus assembly protein PilO